MTAATAATAILILQAQAYQFIDLVNDNSCGLRLWPATARLAFSRQSTEIDTATNVIAKSHAEIIYSPPKPCSYASYFW